MTTKIKKQKIIKRQLRKLFLNNKNNLKNIQQINFGI